jgi:hypothetical protein
MSGPQIGRHSGSWTPNVTGVDLRREIERLSRGPFMDVLVQFLGFTPSEEAIKALAESDPAKYVKALEGLSKLAGFQEELAIAHHIEVSVRDMSDAEIEQKLQDLGVVVEAKVEAKEPMEDLRLLEDLRPVAAR